MPSGYGSRAAFIRADPTLHAGLTAWFRDLYTASAGAVSQWTDKTPNGFHATQATGGNKPTVSTSAAIGNRALFTFDGTDDFMTLVTKSSLISASAFTIYALVKANTASASNTHLSNNNSIVTDDIATSANFGVLRMPVGSKIGWGADIPTAISNQFTLSDATWTKCVWAYDGTKVYARKSGGTDAGVTVANVNAMSATLYLGGRSGGGIDPQLMFGGSMAELIFYNQFHAVAVQNQVFAYQAAYFGV